MQRFVTPVTFHLDPRLLDFWRNVAWDDLLQQRLYLAYACARFPELFRAGDLPGARPTLTDRMREKLRRALATFHGEDTLGQRPPVLSPARVLCSNKSAILELIDRAGPFADEILDLTVMREAVALHGGPQALPNEHLMPAVHLLLVLETAAEAGSTL